MVSHRVGEGEVSLTQRRLVVLGSLRLSSGEELPVQVLIDTGAEINLVRKRLVPEEFWVQSAKARRFVTADQAVMEGGTVELNCEFALQGMGVESGRATQVVCTTCFYDANIGIDVIMSYEWLRRAEIDVRCLRHGLMVNHSLGPVWVPGLVDTTSCDSIQVCVNQVVMRPPYRVSGGTSQPMEDYTVRGPFVLEVIRCLGVTPTLDCFAAPGNERCSRYFTKQDDSLTREWPKAEVLWLNPPWELWDAVCEKLLASECEAICILPAWGKPWVQRLLRAAKGRVYFEAGVRMFEIQGKPVPNTFWGVWALHLPCGPRHFGDKRSPLSPCIFVPRWRPISSIGQGDVQLVSSVSARPVRRALDLFSGTGSVGRELSRLGFDVVSVDVDPANGPTHVVDILNWDYRHAHKKGEFEIIFACPPCEHFSRARTTKPRDLESADRLVLKVLEIVKYFKPEKWFLENPRFGLLRDRPYMAELPYTDVDYCQFSDWGYRKPTRVWGGSHVTKVQPQICDPPPVETLPCGQTGFGPIERVWVGTTSGFHLRKRVVCLQGLSDTSSKCLTRVVSVRFPMPWLVINWMPCPTSTMRVGSTRDDFRI